MNRRDSLRLFAIAGAAGAWPALVLAQGQSRVAVFDGRFAESRTFARKAANAFDCQSDAASLWFGQLAGHTSPRTITGLTTAADAMIIADCARREGAAFRQDAASASATAGHLVAWTITRKDKGPRSSWAARTEQ